MNDLIIELVLIATILVPAIATSFQPVPAPSRTCPAPPENLRRAR